MGNFRFPIKTKLPPGFINARILRDNFKRQQFKENEVLVKSLKFIARNLNLPTKLRLEAQLKLNTLPNYMRSTQIKNRCVDSGHARFVLSDFRLCRYQFRENALNGNLPGVKKGIW
ncbi:mitochondrial 37S ribosomal protein uS14m [Saccharomyces paradoxus]|uniref:37S ribosomal protein MRP2, mitochondrial n=1 Tax=Saccharomyces paradoxus TaxID=27291 RepID=A0A8B8V1T5_SACPA|nr:Mrp2 [Saccharomyces paradoxus]QHS76874.1 Mrp2 [Saccharomyces paradoxus]